MEFQKIKGGFGSDVQNNRFGNNLDYAEEFAAQEVTITICSVPWDVGNIHVGNSIITGKGNVVGWESQVQRDAYFTNIQDKHVFQTRFTDYHAENKIVIPLPFYMVAKYNYIMVEYSDFPTQYGTYEGVRKYFYFIRDFKMNAPNSTEVEILRDDWTTYINLIEFKQFSMLRGHYAIANSSVAEYLENPLENSKYLLTPGGDMPRGRVAGTEALIFNEGEQLFVMAFKGSAEHSQDYQIYHTFAETESAFSCDVIAFDSSDVESVIRTIPKALYKALLWCAFVPARLVSKGGSVSAFGATGYRVDMATTRQTELLRLSADKFGYDSKYADLAKLYTYPYAALRLYDESGRVSTLRIEDTAGVIAVNSGFLATLSGLTLDTTVSGIGGAVSGYNITSIGSRPVQIGGKWYENLFSWDVPTFALVQWGRDSQDVDTLSDRTARIVTTEENANAAETNTNISNAANEATTAVANEAISDNTATDNILLSQLDSLANDMIVKTATSNIDANQQQGSISGLQSYVNGMNNVAADFAPSMIGGELSAFMASVANSFTAGTNSASIAITTGQTLAQAGYTTQNNIDTTAKTIDSNSAKSATARQSNTDTTAIANNAASAMTARSNQAATANAATINTQILEQGYRIEPPAYGVENNNALAPYGIFCNVETANADDIARAGDEFLRYGYPFSNVIQFEGFNVMPRFSYWQVDDMQIGPSGLSDKALDGIRFLLMGGVTVWHPDHIGDIGRISIYENKE